MDQRDGSGTWLEARRKNIYRGSPVPVTGTDGCLQLIDPRGRRT
jgi:hypothetical protein